MQPKTKLIVFGEILSQMNNVQKLSGKLHPHLLQDTQDKRRDSVRPYERPEF